MTTALSIDLRHCVLDAINTAVGCRSAAARFGIAASAALKWYWLWRETGSVAPRAQGGNKRSWRIEELSGAIYGMLEETPDIPLAEIAARLDREHGQRFAPSTVHHFFRRHGWSFKKVRPCERAGPRRRPHGL